MPRVMAAIFPLEFVILPKITYVNFEAFMPRRIYTDGRDFPTEEEPSLMGYSIGKWLDTDGDGRFDTLEVETRNFKGPRTVEFSGIALHDDNQTVVRERIYVDRNNTEVMHNEITIIDHAFSVPWTVDKHYRRLRNVDLARRQLQREQPPHRDRQGELFRRRRRLPDAGAQKSAAAGPALFQAAHEIAADELEHGGSFGGAEAKRR